MQAIAHSSKNTTTPAREVAIQNALDQLPGTRYGSACPRPPSVVMIPQVAPRSQGEPRPVIDPSSESASAKPMLMPAPIEAARPTRLPVLMGGEGGREQGCQCRDRAVHQA